MRERKVAPSGSRYILCTYSYVLFSHELIATVQSVVTGQAPITLEWKITSGRKKQKKKGNNTITKTNRIPQKKKVKSAYVRIRYISHAARVATETEETA